MTLVPVRVFGVVIANGFASESRVFAQLVRGSGACLHVRAFVHSWRSATHPNDVDAAGQFAAASGSTVVTADIGWRRSETSRRTPGDKLVNAVRLLAALPRILLAALAHRPDVVYSSQQRWDSAVAALVARVVRRPYVIHLHYNVGPWLGRGSIRRIRRAAGVICVSDFIAGQVRRLGVPDERITVVPNAVQERSTEPVVPLDRGALGFGADDFVFAFVARLAPGKGHADALLALRDATADTPRIRLAIVGDGPLEPKLVEMAEALGIADRVRFLGYRADVDAVLAMSDAFLHPSRREPFGLSILEAASVGLPTVAYREGGPTGIIDDGRTGLLVAPPDVRGLADAMIRLAADEAAARTMGREAAALVAERFAADRTVDRFVHELHRLLDGAHAAAGASTGAAR